VRVLEKELATYTDALSSRPRLIIGTKSDLEESAAGLEALAAAFPGQRIIAISSFTHEGLSELTAAVMELIGASVRDIQEDE
jgi:GTPase